MEFWRKVYSSLLLLKQEGSVSFYIAEFENRLSLLPRTTEDFYIHYFLNGLQIEIVTGIDLNRIDSLEDVKKQALEVERVKSEEKRRKMEDERWEDLWKRWEKKLNLNEDIKDQDVVVAEKEMKSEETYHMKGMVGKKEERFQQLVLPLAVFEDEGAMAEIEEKKTNGLVKEPGQKKKEIGSGQNLDTGQSISSVRIFDPGRVENPKMLMKGVFNGFDNITLSFGPQNRREGIIAPKKTHSLQPLHPSLSSSSITSILTRKIISAQHARHNTNYHKESDKVNKQIAQLLLSPEPAVSALELTMKILISDYSGVGINYSLVRWFLPHSPLVKLYNLALFVSDSDVETPSLKTHSVAYINTISCPLTSIPLIGCCTLPNFCPLNGKFIFLEVSNFASMWFILPCNSIFVPGILDLSWSRVSTEYWWKDEQFWVIGGTSTHPFAVLQGFLKMPARIDTNFTASPEGFDENGVVGGVSCKFDIANSIIFVKRCKIIMICNLHGIRLLAKNSRGYGFTRLVAVRLNNNGIGTQAYVDAVSILILATWVLPTAAPILNSTVANILVNVDAAAGVLFLGREIVHMALLRRGEADDVEIVGWGFDVILAYDVVYHGHLLDPMFELLCLFLNSGEDYTDFMVLKIKSLRSKGWELLPQTTNAFSSDSSLLSNEFHRVLKQKTREPNLRERLCLGGIYTQKTRTKIATVLNNMGVLTLKHEIGELWGEIFTASTKKDRGKVTSIKLSMHYIVGIAPIGKTLIPKSLMEKYELLKICDKCFQSLIIGDLFLKLEIEIEGVKYSNVKVKDGFCVNGVKLGEYGYSANIWLFNNLIDRNCKNRMLNEAKVLYGGMSDLRVLCRKIDVIKIWLLTFNLEDKVVHLGGSIDKVTISQPKVYSRKNKKGAAGESSEELSPTSPS